MEARDSTPISAFRRSIARRWPVVVLVTLLAVAAAAIAATARSHHYTSSGQVLIVPLAQYDTTFVGTGMFRDSGDATLTAPTAAAVLHSDTVARAAAALLADGTSADTVLADVRVSAIMNTDVLAVVATADSAARAMRLAGAYLEAVTLTRNRVVSIGLEHRIAVLRSLPAGARSQLDALRVALRSGNDPTIDVTQEPVEAKAASSVSAAAIIAVALVGGAFLGLLAAFALDVLAAAVLDESDATRILGVPSWGRVPRLPRSRRGNDGPLAPSQLSRRAGSEYEEIAAQIARREPAGGVYALVSASEGDGRTTSAAAICAALTTYGLRPALVAVGATPGRQLSAELSAGGVEVVSATDGGRPLSKVVEDARMQADVVVIDGVSLRRAGDIALLGGLAQLLVVVRLGHTPKALLAHAREMLDELGSAAVGAVVLGDPGSRRTRSGARPLAAASDRSP